MKIKNIWLGEVNIPLKRPFKTALRQVSEASGIVVKIETDDSVFGYGEAPPTAVITGDTKGSIAAVLHDFIKPAITGRDLSNFEEIMDVLNHCAIKNTSAKACADMALYDLRAKSYGAPLFKLIGGYRSEITTDITISLNAVDEMVMDSRAAVEAGYNILKIKVGDNAEADITRVMEIRKAVGQAVTLRIDANQGWSAKEAVRIISRLEDMGADMELVEQPVKYDDIKGMQFVTSRVNTVVLADECVFGPADAIKILEAGAADMLNIKLMKTGGIYNALKICAVAETYNVPCMIGCMLETKLAVSAAAHLACGKKVIQAFDLDGPSLCASDPYDGGPSFNGGAIMMTDAPGLGIRNPDFIRFEKL